MESIIMVFPCQIEDAHSHFVADCAIHVSHFSVLYSCWVDGQHCVSIKLFVTDPKQVSYYDYVAIGGLVGSVFLVLFVGLGMVRLGKQKKGRKQPPYINPKQAHALGM